MRGACVWQASAPKCCRGAQQCVCAQAAWEELRVQGRGRLLCLCQSFDDGSAGCRFCSCSCNPVLLAVIYVLTASEVLNILLLVVDCDNWDVFDCNNGSAKAPGCKELFSPHVLMRPSKYSSQLIEIQGLWSALRSVSCLCFRNLVLRKPHWLKLCQPQITDQ